jgi:ankyrin repeat protein
MSEIEKLNDRIQYLLSMPIDDEQAIIVSLDNLIKDFDVDEVQRRYVPQSRHKNLLIHEFVRLGLLQTIEHAVNELGFNINEKRESDGNTALHLAYWYQKPGLGELLKKLQADMTIMNNYGESVNDIEQKREKMMNIIWLDTGKKKKICSVKRYRSIVISL